MLVQDQPTIWNGYEVTFRGLDVPPDGRRALRIDVRNSRMAWEAYPKLYPNPSTGQPVASPAIRRGLLTDVYLAAEQYIPGSAISNQGRNATAVVSAMKVPFINLVWLGSILATVGGIWSLLRHYARKRASAAAGGSAADPAGEEPARRAAGG
jgi:cytochrome c biogenesis factor